MLGQNWYGTAIASSNEHTQSQHYSKYIINNSDYVLNTIDCASE